MHVLFCFIYVLFLSYLFIYLFMLYLFIYCFIYVFTHGSMISIITHMFLLLLCLNYYHYLVLFSVISLMCNICYCYYFLFMLMCIVIDIDFIITIASLRAWKYQLVVEFESEMKLINTRLGPHFPQRQTSWGGGGGQNTPFGCQLESDQFLQVNGHLKEEQFRQRCNAGVGNAMTGRTISSEVLFC